MKILHTSDWHAGKVWKGQSRLDELGAVLDDLAGVVERDHIELVLMTGDIFDTASPSADAERLVFGFFRRVGRLGVPSAVIAGNHDSAVRVEAWAQLAELAHVHACGLPKARDGGGTIEVHGRSGERALVAMVPFAPVSRLVSARELGATPERAAGTYARQMQRLVTEVCEGFRASTVNLLMAHTHLHGALIGGSERRVHVGDDWAVRPQVLPASANYVALGHIHLHQQVEAAPAPTWYAGSPLQLDFGEQGQGKFYNVVDARPNQPTRVEARPYVGGRPLRTVTIAASALRDATGSVARGGTPPAWNSAPAAVDVSDRPHLRVVVECTAAEAAMDINRHVRASIPGVLSVDVRLPAASPSQPVGPRTDGSLAPRELYASFRAARRAAPAPAAVLEAFDRLYDAAAAEESAT